MLGVAPFCASATFDAATGKYVGGWDSWLVAAKKKGLTEAFIEIGLGQMSVDEVFEGEGSPEPTQIGFLAVGSYSEGLNATWLRAVPAANW